MVAGPLGDAASMPGERMHLRAVLSMMVGDLRGAAALFEGLVRENPDDWASTQLLMDCFMPQSSGSSNGIAAAGAGAGAAGAGAAGIAVHVRLFPNSSLLRLSGGLAHIIMVTPPMGGEAEAALASSDAASGRLYVAALLDELIAQVELPAALSPAVGRKLTMRGPYLAKVCAP